MKNIICSLIIFLSFISLDCSSEYVVNGHYSKENLYKDFNKSCDDRSIEITLTNDSSFVAPYGASVSNDTLVLHKDGQKLNNEYLQISKVKDARYKKQWLGLPLGLLAGVAVSAICVGTKVIPIKSHNSYDYLSAIVYEVPLGIIIGTTVGWFIGYSYVYSFNP
jgi:hypothetical protein